MAYSSLEEKYGRKFYERDALLNGTKFDEVIIFRPMVETIPPREPITMTLNFHEGTELLSWLGTRVVAENSTFKAIKTYGEVQLSNVDVSYLSVLDSGIAYIDKHSHIDRLSINGTVYMEDLSVVKEPIRLWENGKICLKVGKDSIITMDSHIKQTLDDLERHFDLSGKRSIVFKYISKPGKYHFDSVVKADCIWIFTKTSNVHKARTINHNNKRS